MRKYESYKCNKCGNVVEVQEVGGGTLICCGENMICITEKLTPILLMKAFAGESQARNKYDFFASKAKKEGFEQISEIFAKTALNEKEHAKLHYKAFNKLNNEEEIHNTSKNLELAQMGENFENTIMYPDFAKIAEEEGYKDIAKMFLMISSVEKHHELRYKKLKDLVDNDKVFNDENNIQWICRNCGYIHTGKNVPDKCPVCDHSKAFFERLCENY